MNDLTSSPDVCVSVCAGRTEARGGRGSQSNKTWQWLGAWDALKDLIAPLALSKSVILTGGLHVLPCSSPVSQNLPWEFQFQ